MHPTSSFGPGARRVAAALLLLASACTKDRPSWKDEEPDIFDLKLNEGVTQATPQQAQKAKVGPTRLTFPKSVVADVKKEFPVGKPLLGAASTDSPGDNPFGFIRKVKEVRVEGEEIVVETEDAGLQDVVTGKVRATFDPLSAAPVGLPDGFDLTPYFPDYAAGEGTPLVDGQIAQPLRVPPSDIGTFEGPINDQVSVSQAFDLKGTLQLFKFNKAKTVGTGAKAVTFNISADGNLTSKFKFTPTLRFEFETTRLNLDYVHVSARGQFHIENSIDLRVGVTAANGTEPSKLVGAAKLLEDGPETGQGLQKVIAESGPIQGPVIYGVKTTFRVVLLADCGFGMQASSLAQAKLTLDADMLAGMEYHDDDRGWETLKNFNFTKNASASITSGGGVAVECGVTSRIEWLVADMGGPYLGIRAGMRASAVYVEQCNDKAPENGRPDIKTKLEITPVAEIVTGGTMKAFKVLKFDVGPYKLYDHPFDPFYKLEKEFKASGIGYCVVPCGNGLKDGEELATDCGGPICRGCAAGGPCVLARDCLSGACDVGGTCATGPCEDHQKSGDETDVDCGGKTCRGCYEDFGCATDRDCAYGLCSKASAPPQVCTTNLCRDGVLSGGESDVDCGAAQGCTELCAVGQRCRNGADCASGGCHATTGLCVESACFDAMKNAGETDVDCGGPCAKKCDVGTHCKDADYGTDCGSGHCSRAGICVATACEDLSHNQDETSTDCGGSTCAARCGAGNGCLVESDCEGGLLCNPRTQRCTVPGCDDGFKNGEESSVDCGGTTCRKCPLAKACNTNTDCFSDICSNGRCVNSTCENGVKDPAESDVDCGAACGGLTCGLNKACLVAGDCTSNICADGKCSSDPCKDRLRNGSESDADCGGTCPLRCAAGKTCNTAADCAGGICNETTRRCVADQCHDGTKNGNEADVDCGGSCPDKCATNRSCAANADCASAVCNLVTSRCVPDQCFDGIQNGAETDLDCGGGCPGKCRAGRSCVHGRDCQSGACSVATRTCAADQCSDGRLNGTETGLDCGGACETDCGIGSGCLAGNDCVNPQGLVGVDGYCNVASHECSSTSCGDGVKDGDETGLDCGGSCAGSAKCANNDGCNNDNDCTSAICNVITHKCVADRCQDGVKNRTETDIDCGGICGAGCQVGAACAGLDDCSSGYCTSGLCTRALERSCQNQWYYGNNGQGDHTNGVKLLDPDGPRRSWSGPGDGADAPILTYCDMANGGWTPVAYFNSASFGSPNLNNWRTGQQVVAWDLDFNTWAGGDRHLCNTDAECNMPASNWPTVYPGSVCHRGHCTGTAPYSGLPGPPGPYSVVGTGNLPQSYSMAFQRGQSVSGSEMRWDVYRNGVLLWSTPTMPANLAFHPSQGDGYLFTPQRGAQQHWLRCGSSFLFYPTTPDPYTAESPTYDSRSVNDLNYRCHGWSTFQGFFNNGYLAGTNQGTYSVNNFFNGADSGLPGGVRREKLMWGAWLEFGQPQSGLNGQPYGGSLRMGTCNTPGWCYPTNGSFWYERNQVHRKDYGVAAPNPPISGAGAYNAGDELTNPRSGSEMFAGTEGLVFVFWVK